MESIVHSDPVSDCLSCSRAAGILWDVRNSQQGNRGSAEATGTEQAAGKERLFSPKDTLTVPAHRSTLQLIYTFQNHFSC